MSPEQQIDLQVQAAMVKIMNQSSQSPEIINPYINELSVENENTERIYE